MSRALVLVVASWACGPTPRPAPPATAASSAPAAPSPPAPADDLCPDHAEDVDGFEDGDGCPDLDNDKDRIPDVDDRCPNEPEVYNATDDTDGCPDRGCVLVRSYPMCIDEVVFFDRGKPSPDRARYDPLFDTAAKAMALASPDLELVAITGYRSGDEPAALSRLRAAAIREQLLRRGVDGARLAIVDGGVGPQGEPVAQRRVQLEIAKQRVAYDAADDIVCTPMGRWYVKLTEAEKRARCQPP